MTQDEIIEMAEACGFTRTHTGDVQLWLCNANDLDRLAKLVAKYTLMNIDPSSFMSYQEGFAVGVAKEREACANTVEKLQPIWSHLEVQKASFEDAAAAIRARDEA